MSPQRTSGLGSVSAVGVVALVATPDGAVVFVAGFELVAVAGSWLEGASVGAVSVTVPDVFALSEPPKAPATAISSTTVAAASVATAQVKAERQRAEDFPARSCPASFFGGFGMP